MDLSEISATLREEGAKRGFTSEQINKTLKQIKKGKINLESLAPMLANKFTDKFANTEAPTRAELQKRLSKKINDSKVARAGKHKSEKVVEETMPAEQKEIGITAKKKKASKNKRLNKLAKKYGTIAPETYIESLNYIRQLSSMTGMLSQTDVIEKNRHNNIIKIYEKQTDMAIRENSNASEINFDIDGDYDDESDVSYD
jgi:hypothetical protein